MKNRIFIALCLFCLAIAAHAEEQTSTYRILGLCGPERQDDLRATLKALPEVQLVNLDFDKAEVALRLEVGKLFPDNKTPTAEALLNRLNERLLNASNHTFSLTLPSTLPPDKLSTVEIKVGLLDCKACRYAAYCAVYKIEGVERATVSAKSSTITAIIDATKTNLGALTEALKKANVPLPEK